MCNLKPHWFRLICVVVILGTVDRTWLNDLFDLRGVSLPAFIPTSVLLCPHSTKPAGMITLHRCVHGNSHCKYKTVSRTFYLYSEIYILKGRYLYVDTAKRMVFRIEIGMYMQTTELKQNAHHCSWRRHQMETCSALLALCEGNPPVTGGFPSQRPVTRSLDAFFDVRLNKGLSKQSRCRWSSL